MRILICTQSYRWFRRQWWQLSSLLEQSGPELTYRMHVCLQDPYITLCASMVEAHSSGHVGIETRMWGKDDPEFEFRGSVRTYDLLHCADYDWLLWVDPDIVFHRNFFCVLGEKLAGPLAGCSKVLSLGRHMLAGSDKIVDGTNYNRTLPFDGVTEQFQIPAKASRSTLAAGYFQLVRVQALKDKGITSYTERNHDRSIFPGNHSARRADLYRTFSEAYFRRKLGIEVLKGVPGIGHLEHPRRGQPGWVDDACY